MKLKLFFIFVAVTGAGLSQACSALDDVPESCVIVPKATINGQPVEMQLDTGAATTNLDLAAADRLGIKMALPATSLGLMVSQSNIPMALSEPINLGVDTETITAQFPVFDFSGHDDDSPVDMVAGWIENKLSNGGRRYEVLIGWPEIRGNILVFDSSQRTITSVQTLPLETDGWLKLKIFHSDALYVETTMADGSTGEILVDTGSFYGVALPPTRWNAWKQAHPKANFTTSTYYMPSAGTVDAENTLADEVQLGALTLTHVPLRDANAAEGSGADNFLGSIGLAALERMDMVLDGKNGFAYIRPKPPIGPVPAAPSDINASQKNWTVVGPLSITLDHLLVSSGADKALNGDSANAIADFNKALAINPQNAPAYAARGAVEANLDDNANALIDFNRSLELEPTLAEAYESRATSRQALGDFAGAASDFGKYAEMKSGDSIYPDLYRYILQRRLGTPPDDFASTVAGWKAGWAKTVGQYLLGGVDETALLKASGKPDEEPVAGQKCEAYYFLGMMHLIKGDSATARDFFNKSVSTGMKDYYEYKFSRGELARLDVAAK